jgi:hypothetical protein
VTQSVLYFQRRLSEQCSGRDYKSYIILFSLRDVMWVISIYELKCNVFPFTSKYSIRRNSSNSRYNYNLLTSNAIQGNDEEQIHNIEASTQRTLDCTNCNAIIGMEDPVAKGWRLLKASVSLNTNAPRCETDVAKWEVHPTETIVAAQLLELIERESARRFVVHCGQKSGLVVGGIPFHINFLCNFYALQTTKSTSDTR